MLSSIEPPGDVGENFTTVGIARLGLPTGARLLPDGSGRPK